MVVVDSRACGVWSSVWGHDFPVYCVASLTLVLLDFIHLYLLIFPKSDKSSQTLPTYLEVNVCEGASAHLVDQSGARIVTSFYPRYLSL